MVSEILWSVAVAVVEVAVGQMPGQCLGSWVEGQGGRT